jgi:hypothetical protein
MSWQDLKQPDSAIGSFEIVLQDCNVFGIVGIVLLGFMELST